MLTEETAMSVEDKIQLKYLCMIIRDEYMYGENEEIQNKKKSQAQASYVSKNTQSRKFG